MGDELSISFSYLANAPALADAFETGQVAGSDGFQTIGLLEAGMEGILEEQSLPALLAAYKQALTFGDRRKVLELGQAIAQAIREDHKLLEKILVRGG